MRIVLDNRFTCLIHSQSQYIVIYSKFLSCLESIVYDLEINETGDERTNNNSSRNHQKIVVPDEIMQVVGTAAAMSRERNNSSMLGNTQNDKMRKASTESTGSASVSSSVSSNQFASGSRMNSGNVLTDRPSSRVTQPPGGRSSICFY